MQESTNAQTTTVLSGTVRTSATISRLWGVQQVEEPPEVTDSAASIIAWHKYLRYEFPSLLNSACFHSVDSAYDSVERIFAAEVGRIEGVEELYVRKDRDYYRIWTVLNEPDVVIEDKIYEAQLRFMDQLDLPCDFAVIFRMGKDPAAVRPFGAHRICA